MGSVEWGKGVGVEGVREWAFEGGREWGEWGSRGE